MSLEISNLGAGPAKLPQEVIARAKAEFENFGGTGMSVMEVSHRNKVYEQIHHQAVERLRLLMGIPDSYEVLFLQGGASLQFAMLPQNFLVKGKSASYMLTGVWSEKALQEAQRIGPAHTGGSTKDEKYRRIPSLDELVWSESDAYVHITSNNTIVGSQWNVFPDTGDVPLVADASSDILSRSMDVRQFHLIYAGAQKNLGPSGVTVVIVKSEWLEDACQDIPTILRYNTHAKSRSLYNTPPTFAVYMLGLVLEWAEAQGGVKGLEARNTRKAKMVYDVMDESEGFYLSHVDKGSRSKMNVTFRLQSEALEQAFLAEAASLGFIGLSGHRLVRGCRASLYNAVSVEDCERLAMFMQTFRKRM